MADSAVENGLAYYKNCADQEDIQFPIRRNLIRFSVMRQRGALSSNAWRVWVTDEGSAYVRCRDHMSEMKVSLHGSGDHRIAFTSESGLEMTEGSRLWTGWTEPPFCDGSGKVIPTLKLFFPSWALTLTQEMRRANPKVWQRNQFFIEGAESPMATVVSFAITNDDLSIRFISGRDQRSFPIGVIPVRSGKQLWVVAQYVPEANMQELALQGLRGMSMDPEVVHKLGDFSDGHVLGLCVVGPTPDGGRYWMPYAATINKDQPVSTVPQLPFE